MHCQLIASLDLNHLPWKNREKEGRNEKEINEQENGEGNG
jgi:hypothetical protein